MTSNLSVRARFERFPATLKGAFILRGEDPNPHQVVLGPARIVAVTGAAGRPIDIAGSTLDIAPRQDVFVPFEAGVAELESGWYELEVDVEVDGVKRTYPGGRRFPVPWPRGSTRRGSVRIGKDVRVDGVRVALEQLDCATDHVTITFRTTPPAAVGLTLEADGADVPVFDVDRDDASGAGRATAYPLLKSQAAARIEVRSGSSSGSVRVKLP